MSAPKAEAAGLTVERRESSWRDERGPQWYRDIGYRLQDVVRHHRYDLDRKGTRPTDPGWHECSCGDWEGYWSGFEPHVADHLRAVTVEVVRERDEARAALAGTRFRVEVACMGYEALTDDDVPEEWIGHELYAYRAGAAEAASQIRAALDTATKA